MDRRTDDTILLARTAEGEACLVGRIAAGDRQAFEALYRAYFPRLTRFLHRMTRSAPLIEEIVNDTLLAVWRKASTFDGSSKVSTWIFAIGYRRACSALRAADRPFEVSSDDAAAGVADAADAGIHDQAGPDADRPDWQFERGRLAEAVDAALAQLPPAQRTAFQLTFHHDMSYTDIADIMDCPVNTIKTRLFHARKRLATLLDHPLENRP